MTIKNIINLSIGDTTTVSENIIIDNNNLSGISIIDNNSISESITFITYISIASFDTITSSEYNVTENILSTIDISDNEAISENNVIENNFLDTSIIDTSTIVDSLAIRDVFNISSFDTVISSENYDVSNNFLNNISISDISNVTDSLTTRDILNIYSVDTATISEYNIVNNILNTISINDTYSIVDSLLTKNTFNISIDNLITISETLDRSNNSLGVIDSVDTVGINEQYNLTQENDLSIFDTSTISENSTVNNILGGILVSSISTITSSLNIKNMLALSVESTVNYSDVVSIRPGFSTNLFLNIVDNNIISEKTYTFVETSFVVTDTITTTEQINVLHTFVYPYRKKLNITGNIRLMV